MRQVRTRRTVGSYLVAGVVLWCVTVVALVAYNARAAYDRERESTLDLLALAADAGAFAADPTVDQNVSTLEDVAGSIAIRLLAPAACEAGLQPLRTATESVHVHVLDAAGEELCSVRGEDVAAGPLRTGPWFERALAGEVVVSGVMRDPLLDEPAIRIAAPVDGVDGGKGVLVAVLLTGRPAVEVPKAVPRSGIVLVVDPGSGMVVNRSPGAPLGLGDDIDDTSLERSLRGGGVVDLDGRRYVVEAPVASNGWRVLAGLDESVALAPAERAVRRSVLIGLASLVLIGGLSLYIHRRLARPIRKVGAAIESSWQADTVTLAPTAGPREVARVAEVFNELIVERAAREDDLRHRATHDVLTGLRNRAGIAHALERSANVGGAVLFLDLDRFKLINDSHGHSVGDRALQQLAERLVRAAGPGTSVARFGGDEFLVVVAEGCDRVRASALADRICTELSRPVELDDLVLHLRGSIGIAHGRDGVSPETLLRDADTAMYRAKAVGTGWAVYDEGMGASVRRRLQLESALHGAADRGELSLLFQPLVRLHAVPGAVAGAEALLRWNHPELGSVSPAEFIPTAEESGLIVPIGAWVLDRAAAVAAGWAAAGRPVPVSVNVAALQFVADDMAARVVEVLDRHRLQPELLVVEVTESTMITAAEAMSTLEELRDLGVGVALDDFGTGYSSLSYLERMPATELKIDRSFVSHLDDDGTRRIVRAILRLAEELGLVPVAEGVETRAQAEILAAEGCPLAQGYLYSPAMTVDDFDRYSSSSGSSRSHRSPQAAQR